MAPRKSSTYWAFTDTDGRALVLQRDALFACPMSKPTEDRPIVSVSNWNWTPCVRSQVSSDTRRSEAWSSCARPRPGAGCRERGHARTAGSAPPGGATAGPVRRGETRGGSLREPGRAVCVDRLAEAAQLASTLRGSSCCSNGGVPRSVRGLHVGQAVPVGRDHLSVLRRQRASRAALYWKCPSSQETANAVRSMIICGGTTATGAKPCPDGICGKRWKVGRIEAGELRAEVAGATPRRDPRDRSDRPCQPAANGRDRRTPGSGSSRVPRVERSQDSARRR